MLLSVSDAGRCRGKCKNLRYRLRRRRKWWGTWSAEKLSTWGFRDVKLESTTSNNWRWLGKVLLVRYANIICINLWFLLKVWSLIPLRKYRWGYVVLKVRERFLPWKNWRSQRCLVADRYQLPDLVHYTSMRWLILIIVQVIAWNKQNLQSRFWKMLCHFDFNCKVKGDLSDSNCGHIVNICLQFLAMLGIATAI